MKALSPTKFLHAINNPPAPYLDKLLQFTNKESDKVIEFDMTRLKVERIEALAELANQGVKDKLIGAGALQQKVGIYLKLKKMDVKCKKITSLQELETAFRLFFDSTVPEHWLFFDTENGPVPFVVTSVDYHNATRFSPAYVRVETKARVRGSSTDYTINFHSGDLIGKDARAALQKIREEAAAEAAAVDDDEDEDAEGAEASALESKTSKLIKKAGGATVLELLTLHAAFPATPEAIAAHNAIVERYLKERDNTGAQYLGEGYGLSENDSGHWWTRQSRTSFIREGRPSRLVMDDETEGRDTKDTQTSAYWTEAVALPIHPVVRVFDLARHSHYITSVNNLKHYEYDTKLDEKLVLDERTKKVVNIVMRGAFLKMQDIIDGKSGGTIVLATGVPGTGKTLTAEVAAEVLQRPLYKVQCTQLGTDEASIEKRLAIILKRASRWKAVLLVDEADVYVRERGDDIQQNAIVGVFLRTLEYYRGVMFMTSNRVDKIDDAILSRATLHIRYAKPTGDTLKAIWRVLASQFDVTLTAADIDNLVTWKTELSGRSVKNLLRLARTLRLPEDTMPIVDMLKDVAQFQDL